MILIDTVDIHSHILPGIDDGPDDLNESVDIAKIALREGIRTIVCTPHAERGYDRLIKLAGEGIQRLGEKLDEKKIPIRLHLGFEVLACESLLDYGNLKSLSFPMNGRLHMLVEFDFKRFPPCLNELLHLLKLENIQPVLAHPERYCYLHDNITFLQNMKSSGVMIQVNAGSVTGNNGQAVKNFVKKIVKNGLVDFIATDTHSSGRRGPYIRQAVRQVEDWVSEKRTSSIFYHNFE